MGSMTHDHEPDHAIRFTAAFKRNLRHLAKKYRHIRQDIHPLLDALANGEHPGDQIPDIGMPVYKVRVQNIDAQRGRRGGYRIIYTVLTPATIVLVTVYSKSDQGDIAPHTIRALIEADAATVLSQGDTAPVTDPPHDTNDHMEAPEEH